MKTFIFDLDGTLVYTIPDIRAAANYAMSRHGLPPKNDEQVREYIGHGLDDFLRNIALPTVLTEEQFKTIKADYWEYYGSHTVVESTVYDGVPKMLRDLRERGCRIIMATNKSDCFAKTIEQELFKGMFDYVIGQMDGVPPKPEPALGKYITDMFSLNPQDCIMVGDSKFDMLFAKNCCFYAVGVRWGFAYPNELETSGADVIVTSAEQITALA